jgi:hypothetical protein
MSDRAFRLFLIWMMALVTLMLIPVIILVWKLAL